MGQIHIKVWVVFQDRDEYGEVGEGVRDLVEMTIKKMDLDR